MDIEEALIYFSRGNDKATQELFHEAIQEYTTAINLNPNLDIAYCNRGLAKKNLQYLSDALVDINKALEINPKLTNAYNCRGLVNWDIGNLTQAMEDFSAAIDLNPKFANAILNRGNVKRELESYLQAIPDYIEYIGLCPLDSKGHNNLGAVFAALNQHSKAIHAYTEAIKVDPENETAYTNRGLSKEKSGADYDAINDFTTAIHLNKQSIDVYIHRGNTYQKINLIDNAIVDYCTAIPHSMNLLSPEQQYLCVSKLLKFREINNNNLNAIRNSEIWFAHPNTFTDKQDGTYLTELFPENEAVKKAVELILVYSCFGYIEEDETSNQNASLKNEISMWSMYGQGHQGICLHYQYHPEQALKCALFSFDKINYVETIKRDENISLYDTLQQGFFTKHSGFQSENEYRFITAAVNDYQNNTNRLCGNLVKEIELGLTLVAIDFGTNCSSEDKQNVFNAVRNRSNFESIDFYQLSNADAGSFKLRRTLISK